MQQFCQLDWLQISFIANLDQIIAFYTRLTNSTNAKIHHGYMYLTSITILNLVSIKVLLKGPFHHHFISVHVSFFDLNSMLTKSLNIETYRRLSSENVGYVQLNSARLASMASPNPRYRWPQFWQPKWTFFFFFY